ncbi:hypothetical protein QJQ45_027714 [Haematococcus lacustris]|nr:hypothetical protein QJQ45_001710 [Haematococcus lacustris]KAJ9510877.1 hypothetical protein QJQ45_027714 [Haematococcus lacustris]
MAVPDKDTTSQPPALADKVPQVTADAFEEDTFEEFELAESSAADVKDEPAGLWEADWDDEDVGEDFQQRLRAELDKQMAE